MMPASERHHDRPRLEQEAGVRQREADRVEELEQPLGKQQAEEQPDHRGDDADDERLEDDRPEHLLPRRAERAQRGELARPLGDRDRQRVGDHERADEQRDPAEGEQKALQEGDEVVGVGRVRLRLLAARERLRARRQDLADLRQELLVGNPGLGGDGDLVEPAFLLEQPLRRR